MARPDGARTGHRRPVDGLTDLGRRLVAELAGRLEPWLVEPRGRRPPARPTSRSRTTARPGGRITCDPTAAPSVPCGGLAPRGPARRAGSRADLVPGRPVRGFDTRAVLTRWLLADPDGFERLRDDPGATVSGARPEDIDLVTGRTAEALRACHARIVRGEGDPRPGWGWDSPPAKGPRRRGTARPPGAGRGPAHRTRRTCRPLELGRMLAPETP
ncbi:hypothetical protein [Streptomyces sp. F001]|uniref:hypothetical protein n=1 Tax=Streptomyces sp. F001 TaxID=1510026 RepID=UPI00101E6FCA|nr:hypothetical protein [Streptomyces sp. F001]